MDASSSMRKTVDGNGYGKFPPARQHNPVETLRRRYVQEELQLREKEDRYHRDCARQEQELEVLRLENRRQKAKIEELRMTQTAPQNSIVSHSSVPTEGSKLLGAASSNYLLSREAVDAARQELTEFEARISSTRQQLQDLRRHNTRVFSHAKPKRDSLVLQLRSKTSRAQLQGLELHLETETDRLSKSVEFAKSMRREIDTQLSAQHRTEEVCRNREREMCEIMKEISFLIEVCNLLFEERDACQQRLAEIRHLAETENETYEKAFHELLAVEENDRATKVRLSESIVKLQCDLVAVAQEYQGVERALDKNVVVLKTVEDEERGLLDDDDNALSLQLQEFERCLARLSELSGSEVLSEVERYVCNGNEARFQLYNVLNNTQDAIKNLEQEYEEVRKEWEVKNKGEEEQRRLRAEIESMQALLLEAQREALDHDQRVECVRMQLEAALPILKSIFTALDCEDPRIDSEHGVCTLSCDSALLYLAAVEHRLEEYLAVWRRKVKSSRTTPEKALLLDL